MPLRSLLRIVLYALVAMLLVTVLRLRGPVAPDATPAADELEPPPAVRLARDDQPTIVEPNDGWLHTHQADDSEPGNLPDAPSTVLIPAGGPLEPAESLSR